MGIGKDLSWYTIGKIMAAWKSDICRCMNVANATWLPLQFVNFLSNVNAFDWALVHEPPEDYDVYFNRLDPKPND